MPCEPRGDRVTLDRGPEAPDPGAPEGGEPPPATVGAGRYVVGPRLGRGGSGEVFRAQDRLLGRPVALKMFPRGVAVAEDVRRWREVRTLAGLDHDRLVRIYDVGEHDTRPFFVMQLVEGSSLAAHLRTSALDVPAALHLGVALASGLGHVHAHGIVHRDVKPANVLLDEAGHAFLTDFGIATRIGAAALTEDGVVLGTAAYLAPEQVRGEPVGPAADVYSLGLVLLESLTGRREYPGEVIESAIARLHRRPDPPAVLGEEIVAILRAMTADAPADRPGAHLVVTRLTALLRGARNLDDAVLPPHPVAVLRSVMAAPPRSSAGTRGRAHRTGWAVSAVVAVLLGLGLAAGTQGAATSAATGATLAAPLPETVGAPAPPVLPTVPLAAAPVTPGGGRPVGRVEAVEEVRVADDPAVHRATRRATEAPPERRTPDRATPARARTSAPASPSSSSPSSSPSPSPEHSTPPATTDPPDEDTTTPRTGDGESGTSEGTAGDGATDRATTPRSATGTVARATVRGSAA
jgi:hypothetical protein